MDYLSKSAFDVVMMQEVGLGSYCHYHDASFDPLQWLRNQGYQIIYAKQFDLQDGSGSRGNVIASRYPIIEREVVYNNGCHDLVPQTPESLGIDLDVSVYTNRIKKRALERA